MATQLTLDLRHPSVLLRGDTAAIRDWTASWDSKRLLLNIGVIVVGAGLYGAAMGSYAVSHFGIRGFEGVTLIDVQRRVRTFRDLTHVPLAELVP